MSNIDKQALLKIAESVDREEWDVLDNGDDEYQVIVSGSLERGATYRSYRPVANEIPEQEIAAFIAAANPATVLALLDENIQLQRGKDAMEAVALALRDDMRDAREKLEAAERRKADNQEPASERERIRRAHAEWSDATFGEVGPIGPLKHLSKEALEAAADPSDPLEWADMQFLLWDAQRRMGISDEFITRAMIEKLAINKARQWPEPKDGEPRLHIKEQPASVVPDERAAFNAWNNEDNLPIAGVGAKNAAWLAWQARASLCGNSALNVPPERPADSSNGDDVEAWFDEGWNACRTAMLNGGKS
ncbi:DUF550 domain-containing protein [Salmonella enterica subsp. enterica serovar Adabraka]|nr:DUF550 domain-containing protein [Salmonella enterica subsp. enterica serovar Adabraka]